MITAMFSAALLAGATAPQAGPAPAPAPSPVASLVAQWSAPVDAARAEHRSKGPARSAAEKIMRLVEIDQAARQAAWVMQAPRLTPEDQEALAQRVWVDGIAAIDRQNLAALLPLIPSDGWFRNSRDGRAATHGAWLIVQHSQDLSLMQKVLRSMEGLVRQGEVEGKDYALLYDRVAMMTGRPQRYGSQGKCTPGLGSRLEIPNLEDPAHVDARRIAVGWVTAIAETKADLEIGKPCG